MKVAAVQINAERNKDKNIQKALAFASKAIANKAMLIVLPEVFNYRGPLAGSDIKKISEDIPGTSVIPFLQLAKEKKVFILLGSIYERANTPGKAYNTSVFIDNKGKIKAKYRKMHLFSAAIGQKRIKETKYLVQGRTMATASLNAFKIGLSICYDLRFPLLYDEYFRKGCDVLAVPSSFTRQTGQLHWESLLRARAIENICYVIAPNQTGKNHQGIESYGNSMILAPSGKILARASGDKEEIIYANMRQQELDAARRMLPAIKKERRGF